MSKFLYETMRFTFLLWLLFPITIALVTACVVYSRRKWKPNWPLIFLPYILASSHIFIGLYLIQEVPGAPAQGRRFLNMLPLIAVLGASIFSVYRAKENKVPEFCHAALSIWIATSFCFTADKLIAPQID